MIKGKVTDITTGGTIPGVNVFISDPEGKITSENKGGTTDAAGNYSFQYYPPLGGGPRFITASAVGYESKTWLIPTGGNGTRNFALQAGTMLGITEITATAIKKPCCIKKAIVILSILAVIILVYRYTRKRSFI